MKLINKIDDFFFTLAKIGMFICMILITINAVGRYIFNMPITGAYEFTENYLMVIMIFLSLSYTWKHREFIAITFISEKFPIKVRNIVYFGILILGIAFFGLIGYEGYLMTIEAFVKKQTTIGIVQWPVYTSKMWVPIGSSLIVLRMAVELVIGIMNIQKKGIQEDLFADLDFSENKLH